MSLTPEQFRRADALFQECVRRSEAERDPLLQQQCPDDSEVRDFVRTMLAHDASPALPPTAHINQELRDQARTAIVGDDTERQIGPYRLLEKLGEGGFGSVWLAEQEQPVRRRVALKVIKLGMDTRQIVARFEAERQALAMMDHPGIARVFDAGATAAGRPFFVMELVRGLPITHYCDARRLPTHERASLFIDVCRAVQHAHHKGIIHRDLKPSNILVTEQDGRPAPKIIDFGIAKAVAQPLTDASIYTRQHQIMGTPAYMSPEQADSGGLDVDTRTDVYSLGVVLYELLAGALPFDQRAISSPSVDALRRIIREHEPPRPSVRCGTQDVVSAAAGSEEATRMAGAGGTAAPADRDSHKTGGKTPTRAIEVASLRRTDPATLRRQLRGELDWITMMAVEKDRTRRYDSPAALAADLERFLRHDAVLASPPTATYRLRKFVRRHRALLATSAVVLFALVGGLVAATWGWVTARQERDRAGSEAAKAHAVNQFLDELFASVNPMNARGRDVTVREVFDQADARIASGSLRNQPEVEASVRFTLGQTYRALGHTKESETQFRAALALRERTLGVDAPATLEVRAALGSLLTNWGNVAEGAPLLRNVLESRERRGIPPDTTAAALLSELGRVEKDLAVREALLRRAYEFRCKLLPPEHADIGDSLIELAWLAVARKNFDDAVRLSMQALEIHRRAYIAPHPQLAASIYCLAEVLMEAHRPADAISYYREAADMYLRVFPENQTSAARALNALGVALLDLNRAADAEPVLREALACEPRSIAESPTLFADFRGNLGSCLMSLRRFDEAEPLLVGSLAVMQSANESADDIRLARRRLYSLYRDWNRPEKAAEFDTPASQPADR